MPVPANRGARLSPAQYEAFRVLRSNLTVSLADLERPVVIVTSAYAGEGKTSTAINLAKSMAAAGQRVVLVDADLRHPDAHRWLGVHNEHGLTDILLDRRAVDDALQYIDVGAGPAQGRRALYLLAAGPSVENPGELLGTKRTAALLDALAAQADVVLIDTPPVLQVADTLVIAHMAAGALLVAETRRTPVAALQRTKDALTRNQSRLLGIVINKFQARDAGDADAIFEYSYGYGDDGDAGAEAWSNE